MTKKNTNRSRRKPDVQKRLFYEAEALVAARRAVKLRDEGDERGAKKAEAEALEWLKKLKKEEAVKNLD
jgi:hypothetical protein